MAHPAKSIAFLFCLRNAQFDINYISKKVQRDILEKIYFNKFLRYYRFINFIQFALSFFYDDYI